ncbi:hypothetical protein BYT27DRAFT_7218504 [Phlegmacium glaucopus]|nr:hypothetical protein BYT27DRAFT_7218504 [Phlegmacium glaucopus]
MWGSVKYTDLDLNNNTFNSTKPFRNPIIKDLIQSLWFSNSKVKSDTGTTVQIVKNGEVPFMILFLVASVIEHSIGEYRNGVQTQALFKECQARSLESSNLASLMDIEQDNSVDIEDVKEADLDCIADEGISIF